MEKINKNILTIKDFSKGEKAYLLFMNRGRSSEPEVKEVEVQSVGRIYIIVGYGAWARKFQNQDCEYLLEKAEYGEAALLFKTKKDAENYIEKCNLALWLGCLSVNQAEKYSLKQLKKVKEVLS